MADYYTTGQITLTNGSASIVGVGTAWVIANVAGGTIFVEGTGNALPLDDIADDTHATASIEWKGASGTYNYALLRATAFSDQLEANSNIMSRLLVGLEAGTFYRYEVAKDLADKSGYDERPEGFAFLAIDVNPAQLFIKASATSGDWRGPFSYGTGPQGEPGPVSHVTFAPVTTGAAGSNASMVVTGTGTEADPFVVAFTIPRGNTGAGDVTGPSSSANNRFALFSDATGKVLKDSGVTIGDAASKNTGSSAGTLAAGDDSRFSDNAKLSAEDQTLTGGARVTSKSLGTLSTGTLTLDPGDRPLQHYTNNGAHTLAPGSNTGSFLLDITNGASAGAITLTGWTKVAGDAFTTTSGNKFRCHASIGNGGSVLIVQAMQ